MLPSEKMAIAAHLHVLLRRKTGRVTDTEWMAGNAEYAAEIVRFARASAKHDGHADLGEWAAKLEAAMAPTLPAATMAEKLLVTARSSTEANTASPPAKTDPDNPAEVRYVRGIR